MSLVRRWQEISLAELTTGHALFALPLSAALLAAERTNMLSLYRAVYTSWACALLLGLSVLTFAGGGPSLRRRNLWLLFWTGGWLTFLVHALYALCPVYNAADRLLLPGGSTIRVGYYVLASWWGSDVALAWLRSGSRAHWISFARGLLHALAGLGLFLFAWCASPDFVLRGLSLALIGAALLGVALRIDRARSNAGGFGREELT
jgi:hypothetical protein